MSYLRRVVSDKGTAGQNGILNLIQSQWSSMSNAIEDWTAKQITNHKILKSGVQPKAAGINNAHHPSHYLSLSSQQFLLSENYFICCPLLGQGWFPLEIKLWAVIWWQWRACLSSSMNVNLKLKHENVYKHRDNDPTKNLQMYNCSANKSKSYTGCNHKRVSNSYLCNAWSDDDIFILARNQYLMLQQK